MDRVLGRGDNGHRAARPAILEGSILDVQNPGASNIRRRGDRCIRNHDCTLSCTKLTELAGFLESETNIPTGRRPLENHDGVESSLRRAAAIDLEPVRLNGNLELPGAGVSVRRVSLDELDVRIWVIDPD